MPNIYINTDRPVDRSIVAGINQPQREAPIGALVAGSSYDTNLYFVKNDGTYNAASGDAGASVQVAISTLGKPQSGTFTLTDGTDTTSAIEYGASALEVQTALNALNGGSGVSPIPYEGCFYTKGSVSSSGINVDATLQSAEVFYLKGEVKSDDETIYARFNNTVGGAISITNTDPGNWISFTKAGIGVVPSDVGVGLSTIGTSAAFWRNIELVAFNFSTGFETPIATWPGNERLSGSLDGVVADNSRSALDTYDGTYLDCEGAIYEVGIGFSQVTVEKVTDQQYAITFDELGERNVISGSNVSLYPESTPTASIAVAGSETTNAQQIIEITRQPAVYQATWSTITNGFNATLALNTTRLLQSLLIDNGLPFYIEVKLNGETVAREAVRMELSTMPASAFSATGLTTLMDTFAANPNSNGSFSASTWRSALDINIYGQLYFSATAATTIAAAGTYVKLAGTTTSDSLNGITMPQNNRLQNNSGTARVFQAMARTDIVDGSGNKAIAIKLAKNGILINPTESNGETTNNVGAHAIINWIVSLADGEYVEIWATNKSDTSNITAQHGHLFLKAID